MAAKGVNKVIILGNLGAEPEIRFLPNGEPVANFTVATSEHWTDKSGEKKDAVEWHRCTAYNKLASIIQEYVHKGDKIYCEGRLQTRSWEQDGIKRYATEIIVNTLQMLGSKQESGQQQTRQAQQHEGRAPAGNGPSEYDQSIPF